MNWFAFLTDFSMRMQDFFVGIYGNDEVLS